jgi:hypothetical protein
MADGFLIAEVRRRIAVLAGKQFEGVAAMNLTGVAVRPTWSASK